MGWLRRTARTARPHGVGPEAFDSAAQKLGITLDAAQRQAALELATTEGGVYLWGPVGRGKSRLMSIYSDALPTHRKRRVHFHEFFRSLHPAIRRHRNNLAAALDELLDGADVVCFDEFHVHDPADGKFLSRLLPALLSHGVTVVLTSNYPPRSLMPNPLFHDGFVPTIELIEQHLTVVALDGPVDYRTVSSHDTGFAAGSWIAPASAHPHPQSDEAVTIAPAGHPIRLRRGAGGALWIGFSDLCVDTTAPSDYLALAEEFGHWVISEIPDLRAAGREPSQRFANVVDVLYDRDITTTFISAVPLSEFTDGALLPHDIERVMSRLATLPTVAEQRSDT
ncbi:cell division protein ZapE [Rhodococcus artemisiae]|uniref:Cell division protein ZapE n=1 Tax=Rhodococcus artemisiae TaxID=714159 RepID=A0ABU7LDD1_9NOCA|nr:cell division protein ZapE [Rhodococcus artemisiae]MEE2059552.1 cell division protein ZapE [Rhodococcus artemisiae]